MVGHSDESQTKLHAHSPGDGNSLLAVRRKIFQQVYTSWMANVLTPHQEPGWFQKGFDCVFLPMLVPVQIS